LWRSGERWDDRLARVAARPGARDDDSPAGEELLADWRRAVDVDAAGLFERRLSWAGLDETAARGLLADDPEITEAPAWWPAFEHLRAALEEAAGGAPDAETWLEDVAASWGPGEPETPFAHLWWPAARRAWRDVATGASIGRPEIVFDEAAARDAQLWLTGRLAAITVHPLMERFTVDRRPGQAILLALGAEPPQSGRTRYASFTRAQAAGGLAELCEEFPVLPRLLAVTVRNWSRTLVELLSRLAADAGIIADTFGAVRPLRVLRLGYGAGDAHCGGRMVAILALAGVDGPVRVVYKPKDMRLEREYHRLVAESIGAPLDGPPVQALAIGETHGYVSFVEHRPAGSEAQLAAFYRNAGRLLALLHLLGATDCHHENIIACADMPVLIDPETLFACRIGEQTGAEERARADAGPDDTDLGESILRTGMLPCWQFSAAGRRATDISALGVEPDVSGEETAAGWININTDAMAWGARPAPRPARRSLPVAGSARNPLPRFVDELVDGFVTAGRQLTEPAERRRLADRLTGFTGMRRRMVLRATRVYGLIEQHLFRPEHLRAAVTRGLELERLSRGSLLAPRPFPLWQFFLSELHDMESLDIPYFDHALGSRDLSGGGRIVPDALAEDGLARAVERVRQTSSADLDWQAQLIRAAVGARAYRMVDVPAPAAAPGATGSGQWRDGERAAFYSGLLEALEQAGVQDARGRTTWLSLGLLGDGMQGGLGFMDAGYYSGRAGLMAFLAMLAAAGIDRTVSARATALALRVWTPLYEALAQRPAYDVFRMLRDHGLGMTGAGGVLRLLALPGLPVPAAEVDEVRTRVIEALDAKLVAKDTRLDVIGGAAGAIGPLIDQPGGTDDVRIRTALQALADHLRARQDAETGGWITRTAPRALTGYAHGAAGIGLALLRAGAALGDERCILAGARAFAYEHSRFDRAAGNWPDLRTPPPARAFMTAWCHGAGGIGLARARAVQLLPDHPAAAQWREEIHCAGAAVAAAPAQPTDHLCCGNAGRAAVLRALGAWTGDQTFLSAGKEIDGAILAHWRTTGRVRFDGMKTGTTMGIAGFMTGLPGIGMHLLGGAAETTLMALLA
jgi:type 2 lantibiotic biosynthesis protein LanM